MKIFKLVVRICSMLFTSVFLFCLILFFSGIYPYIVLSGSMEPVIKTGSIVLVQTRETDIKTGDIILYQSGMQNVTHRVAEQIKGGYITKGDANTTCDLIPVKKTQVKGKIAVSIPYLGYAVLFLRTPYGICLSILILIVSLLGKHFLKYHSRKENTETSEGKI